MSDGLYAYLEALDDTWETNTPHDVYNDEERELAEGWNNLTYYAMDTRTASRRNIRHIRCMAIFRDETCETLLRDHRGGKDIGVLSRGNTG